jgi:hypothetical protein
MLNNHPPSKVALWLPVAGTGNPVLVKQVQITFSVVLVDLLGRLADCNGDFFLLH